jgi:hypothetical protein
MKKTLTLTTAALCLTLLLTGCVGLQLGGGSKTVKSLPTVGQELVDLQKAKDSGAINETEYQNQREKILRGER